MAKVSINKKVVVEKKGLKFEFYNFTVDECGNLYMEYGVQKDHGKAELRLKNRIKNINHIYFPNSAKVEILGKITKVGGLTLEDDTVEELLKIKEEYITKVEKYEEKLERELKENNKEVILRYLTGTWILRDDFSETKKWKEIRKELEDNKYKVRSKLKEFETEEDENDKWEGLNYTYKIKYNDLINIIKEIKNEDEEKKQNKELIKSAKYNELLKKAQETNKKQILEQTYTDCTDEEDCTTDLIIKYVNPDGKITIERQHTC